MAQLLAKRGQLQAPPFGTASARRAENRIRQALHDAFQELRPRVAAQVRQGLEELRKFSPEEARDDRGRWTDDEMDAIPGMFHGTDAKFFDQIKAEGLKPGQRWFGRDPAVYLGNTETMAVDYAARRATLGIGRDAAIDPDKTYAGVVFKVKRPRDAVADDKQRDNVGGETGARFVTHGISPDKIIGYKKVAISYDRAKGQWLFQREHEWHAMKADDEDVAYVCVIPELVAKAGPEDEARDSHGRWTSSGHADELSMKEALAFKVSPKFSPSVAMHRKEEAAAVKAYAEGVKPIATATAGDMTVLVMPNSYYLFQKEGFDRPAPAGKHMGFYDPDLKPYVDQATYDAAPKEGKAKWDAQVQADKYASRQFAETYASFWMPKAYEKWWWSGPGVTLSMKGKSYAYWDKQLGITRKGVEDEARDDHGRWTTGGGEELYHGTPRANAEGILEHGITPGEGERSAWASRYKFEALNYAAGRTREWAAAQGMTKDQANQLDVALVVAAPSGGVRRWSGGAATIEGGVAPHEVKRVELYRLADVERANDFEELTALKPHTVLDRSRKSADEEVHFVVPAEVLYADHRVCEHCEQLGKASGDRDDSDPEWVLAGQIAERLDLEGLSFVVDEVSTAQQLVAGEAGTWNLVAMGVDDQAIVDQIDQAAADWAETRAAELVGMRYDDDGNLVPAARAEYRIDDSTRDMVRQTIYEGLRDGNRSEEIASALELGTADATYPFSEERAALIANTEIRRAHNQGSVLGMKAAEGAGVVVKKQWITSGADTVCEDCADNAAAGPIDMDDDFPSGDDAAPAHPNCNCDVVASIGEPEELELDQGD